MRHLEEALERVQARHAEIEEVDRPIELTDLSYYWRFR